MDFKVEEASAGQAVFVYPDGLPLADMGDQTGWDLDPANEDVALFDAILADVSARLGRLPPLSPASPRP